MISIIIPTLNEEDHLPLLLKSIKGQSFRDYEIIVSDAGSTDKTLSVAREYGCAIIAGGIPAKGRNEGALIARGDLLVFTDADVVLPKGFFKKSITEFGKRGLEMASFRLKSYPGDKFIDFMLDFFYNKPLVVLENVLPHAATVIFIKSELFKKINGYDETIKLAEDHDMARRAKKIAKFGIIRSTEVFTSDRRVRKDGWSAILVKFFLCELHLIFIGPVRSDIFKYRFNHYKYKKEKI